MWELSELSVQFCCDPQNHCEEMQFIHTHTHTRVNSGLTVSMTWPPALGNHPSTTSLCKPWVSSSTVWSDPSSYPPATDLISKLIRLSCLSGDGPASQGATSSEVTNTPTQITAHLQSEAGPWGRDAGDMSVRRAFAKTAERGKGYPNTASHPVCQRGREETLPCIC